MRTQDLIPAFLEELKELDEDRHAEYVAQIPEDAWEDDESSWWTEEEASDLLYELFDVLDEYAPPYVYFGALEGDGSDYGFWIDRHALQEAIENGEVLRVEDLSEAPEDYEGFVLHENDHGNLTLYECANGNFLEIWSVV